MESPENYKMFLKLLVQARKNDWSPGKVKELVKIVLLTLFISSCTWQ